jgi:iron complex outermembrane recepter protein
MKKHFFRISALLSLISGVVTQASAQKEADLYSFSLEQLMDVKIESASKKSESVFDAPVSSYVISREEIKKSGVTSIPEALRLCPGVIVREMTNGNYDVHIRGLDNLPRYTSGNEQINLITLVMIDNRPIFNYNQGGILWETLPIGLIDIDRIEIVRGPSSPLYGPNAVAGVINILTRRNTTEKVYTSANVQYGSANTGIGNVAVGAKVNPKFDVIISGNYQKRDRFDHLYYIPAQDVYADNSKVLINPYTTAHSTLALESKGVNAFLNYAFSRDAGIQLSAGAQEGRSQKSYVSFDVTPMGFTRSTSRYLNLAGNYKGIGTKISYTSGYDNINAGTPVLIPEYDFTRTDIVVDYQWNITDQFSLRPAVNYQNAQMNDDAYVANSALSGFINTSRSINVAAGSLRADWTPIPSLRLVGATRFDKFSTQDKIHPSFQFSSSYKLTQKYLVRAVFSRSHSGAFMAVSYLNARVPAPDRTTIALGNPDTDLTQNTALELGFRAQMLTNLHLDIDVFNQRLQNLNGLTFESMTFGPDSRPIITTRYQNLPLNAIQNGITASVNYIPVSKLQIKPFITYQHTEVKNLPVNFQQSLSNVMDDTHRSTPSFYGGFYLNYAVSARWNINLNSYAFSRHTLYNNSDVNPARQSVEGQIKAKYLLNAKVSYNVWDKLQLFVNARNLTNNNSREYYGTDRNGGLYLAGASYNF